MDDGSSGERGARQDGAAGGRTEDVAAGARPPRRWRLWLWGAVALAVALALAAAVGRQGARPGAAGESAAVAIGGPFRLTDQDGRAVDASVLKGRWSAVFFGYTSCPDVCPATLQALGAVQDRLKRASLPLRIVLITVDPERDHPAELKVYLSQPGFPTGALGLTGTPQQIAAVARAYHAFYARHPRPGGGYDMDHSAFIYLMDPKGRFVRTLAEQEGPPAMAAAIAAAGGAVLTLASQAQALAHPKRASDVQHKLANAVYLGARP